MKPRQFPAAALVVAGVLSLFSIWTHVSPSPFSFKGDMWLLGSPISHLIGQAWSSGEVPRIFWSLGDGYNPWLAGQSGVAYPMVTLAYQAGQWTRSPERIQDWLALMNMLALCLWVWAHPLFRKASPLRRWLLALLPAAHPAAVILGQNWLYMHSTATWSTITLLELLAWLTWPSVGRFKWRFAAAVLLLFTAIHIQLFGFFLLFAALFSVCHPRFPRWWARSRPFLSLLGCAVLPCYAAIWIASLHANPAWAPPQDWRLPLLHGQSLTTVLKGAFLGNLPGSSPSFEIWRGVSPFGQGMFFLGPAVLIAPFRLGWRDTRAAALALAAMLVLMGITTLPWLAHLFIGPFGSFRWTWKLAVFLPAFSLACLAPASARRNPRLWDALISMNLALSIVCGVRGLSTDFLPSLAPAHAQGVASLYKPLEEVKNRLGLAPEDRILPAGQMSAMDEAVPLAWLALNGNAPALADVGTLALYDNLEPADSAQFRGGFSVPWRTALPDQLSREAWSKVLPLLASRGVRWLIFRSPPPDMPVSEQRPLDLSNGERLWAVAVPGWRPRMFDLHRLAGAPPPLPSGSWPVPEGEWVFATAREVTFPGSAKNGAFRGPGTFDFDPLAGYGPLIAAWYALVILWFGWKLRKRSAPPLVETVLAPGEKVDPRENQPD